MYYCGMGSRELLDKHVDEMIVVSNAQPSKDTELNRPDHSARSLSAAFP